MTDAIVRKPSKDEADAVAALINAHSHATHGEPSVTADIARDWLGDPTIDIRVAERDGVLFCYGDVMFAPDGVLAHLDVREHPDHPGAATTLLDVLEATAIQRGATTGRTYTDPAESSYVGQLQARGYRPIRHSFEMLTSLENEQELPRLPAGVVIRAAEEGQERLVYEAHMASFADHWGFELRPFEAWARRHVESSNVDRSLSFLAWDGDAIAGVCLCAPHQSGQPGYGWVDVLGVLRPWRRRGLGLALLLHAFGEFRSRGSDRVGLGVDGESTTGALELYERAGMHAEKQMDTFERTL